MSKDIRSFFTVISKKSGTDSKKTNPPSLSLNKKKPKAIIDSDDEDIVSATPQKSSPTKKPIQTKRKIVLSSDSEEEILKDKAKTSKKTEIKDNTSKLKPAKVEDVFKNVPIKQSKVEFTPKPTPEKKSQEKKSKSKQKKGVNTELGIHNDVAFEETLMDLDDDILDKTLDMLEQSALQKEENNENKPTTSDSKENEPIKKENEPKTGERKRSRTDSSSDRKTPKKPKIEHTDSGIDPGQEAHERKRYSAMLYQKYLNRGGPKHHGMKEIPKGKPNCLNNLCFLRTGVLDSLESEEFETLIKSHGGRVVAAVSKKVNYVVVGDDPGPAKLSKAESYNIKTINEDELFDLILVKSDMEPKYCKKDTSLSSEDLGIEVDRKSSPENEKPEKKTSKKIESTPKLPEENNVAKPSTSTSPETAQPKVEKLQTEQVKPIMDLSAMSFAEKYKPTNIQGIIGQHNPGSNMNMLRNWLKNWNKNQILVKKKVTSRPSPYAKHDGGYFKCALLSGPPGVGKTTTATLVAKDLGLDIVEFNASDTRSKRLLHEEVSQLLSSKTIAGFATGKPNVSKNRVLLMDEVDGMAGNEDRGGIQELIQLIKNSSIPIICMCNDRNHQKIRSLVNYCYDLRFTPPKPDQILGAMMTICFKEKINIAGPALKEIIIGSGCDVRQVLNHLSMLAVSGNSVSVDEAKHEANKAKKDKIMGPWEVCRAVFTKAEHQNMSIADKARLFFYDYSLGPLFVQENYLKVRPSNNAKDTLLKATLAADSISRGDIIDAKIRSSNNWSLLESQAMFSSVLPGHYMSGQFRSQINFPLWLGKNSKKNKFSRMISEIQTHTRTSTSASKMAIKLDYLHHLKNAIVQPLKRGMEGVDEAVEVMKSYNLLREDFDYLLELCQWHHSQNPNIETKVKTAFTRTYNKRVTLLPYAPTSGVTRKKASTAEDDMYGDEEENEEDDNEEDDDISKNAMIKVKQTAKGKKTKEETAGTSKRGKGKKK